jgi:ribosome recycling factor
MLDEIYQETSENMAKSITSLENEFKRIRTLRSQFLMEFGWTIMERKRH